MIFGCFQFLIWYLVVCSLFALNFGAPVPQPESTNGLSARPQFHKRRFDLLGDLADLTTENESGNLDPEVQGPKNLSSRKRKDKDDENSVDGSDDNDESDGTVLSLVLPSTDDEDDKENDDDSSIKDVAASSGEGEEDETDEELENDSFVTGSEDVSETDDISSSGEKGRKKTEKEKNELNEDEDGDQGSGDADKEKAIVKQRSLKSGNLTDDAQQEETKNGEEESNEKCEEDCEEESDEEVGASDEDELEFGSVESVTPTERHLMTGDNEHTASRQETDEFENSMYDDDKYDLNETNDPNAKNPWAAKNTMTEHVGPKKKRKN